MTKKSVRPIGALLLMIVIPVKIPSSDCQDQHFSSPLSVPRSGLAGRAAFLCGQVVFIFSNILITFRFADVLFFSCIGIRVTVGLHPRRIAPMKLKTFL